VISRIEPPPPTSTAELLEHIVSHHHEYLRDALPRLQRLAPEVAREGGERDPRLQDLDVLIDDLIEAMIPHMVMEEQSLFPAILAPRPDRAAIARELASMQRDHRFVDELLVQLRAATDGFTPPAWAGESFRALCAELAALEADLRTHVALEDEVLAARFAPR
jgi:regulator of cell morphogenesis and NO signaling